MPYLSASTVVLAIGMVLLLARPANAFGAGNIASVSKVEGLNWRHGDIEDTLLTLIMSRAAGGKKFTKMDVKRVYFGNWLRDYSQAVDVGTVKYVSAEAIRILLWVLGFMTFGYGSHEFFVSAERLGCYRPEDHIDNPKDYADNLDARDYDRRLRGPIDERVELAVDPRTGLKNYIANERAGCMTSARHVRRLFGDSIRLGRSFARSHNKDELYEALRLLGTGLHCLEDYSAHSNYTELALIEMGEREVFPHVGQNTALNVPGAQHRVFPLITGTFGGVDFLHSIMGEFSDKATQSEIQELEGTMQSGQRSDDSVLKDLLDKIPSGLIGGDQAGKADELKANATAAQMQNLEVSPREPEAFTRQMQEVSKQIYPIIEWHDELMKSITEAIEKIPILPDLIAQFEEQLNVYVFSLLAPFVLPIINQIKNELNTGSSEVIQSSKNAQLIVFHDDRSSDPTHSMLSKDHFSNILNEPAGRIASAILKWVVPQLIACWDDERVDADRTINRIIAGVFHHPAQRNQDQDGAADGRMIMFNVVEQWWCSQDRREQDELRRKLSRDGVYRGENHKEGVHDTGHGCGKPLRMTKNAPMITGGMGGGLAGAGAGALLGGISEALGGGSSAGSGPGRGSGSGFATSSEGHGRDEKGSRGGNALTGLVGALAGSVGGGLLSNLSGGSKDDDRERPSSTYRDEGYTGDGGYRQEATRLENRSSSYEQSQYQRTDYPGGERHEEAGRFAQGTGQGHGYQERVIERPVLGGYERSQETRYEGGMGGSNYREQTTEFVENRGGRGSYGSGVREEYGRDERSGYGGDERQDDGREERGRYGGGQSQEYGREEHGGYGGGQRHEYGREERGGYGGDERQEYGREERRGYGDDEREYGETPQRSNEGGYGRGEESYGETEREEGYSRHERENQEGEYREEREEGGGGWFS